MQDHPSCKEHLTETRVSTNLYIMTTTTYTQEVRAHVEAAEAAARGPRLAELELARRALEAEMDAEVRAMREAGDTWARVGACLGVTRQAAQQRYGTLITDSGRV